MKKTIYFLSLTFILFKVTIINAQDVCGTPHNVPNISYSENSFLFDDNPICVNVWFHIIKDNNGNNGYNSNNLNTIIQLLNSRYNPHNIVFNLSGYDIINNPYYTQTNFISNSTIFNNLINVNKKTNALNIYLGAVDNSGSVTGKANGIPGYAVAISFSRINTSTVPHEVGHVLNLFHTHHGSACEFESNNSNYCQELINGSNCGTCGDFVCDTPADPCIGGLVTPFSACSYIGTETQNGISYQPNTHNIMSYSPHLCRDHFSIGQGTRMRQALLNNPTLNAFISTSCYQITGPDLICTNGTYNISNFPSGASVIWSILQNGIVTFNDNTIQNPTITLVNSNTSGTFTLVATITSGGNTFSVSKVVKYGKPYFLFPSTPPANPGAIVFDPELENCNVKCYHASISKIYSTSNALNATSVTWQKLYSVPANYSFWSGSNNTVTILFKAANQMVHLKRIATNTCGSINEEYEFCSNTTQCTSGARYADNTVDFKVYPNPVIKGNTITIEILTPLSEQKNQILELVNEKGNIMFAIKELNNSFIQIPIIGYKAGVYYVKIGSNVQKVVIN